MGVIVEVGVIVGVIVGVLLGVGGTGVLVAVGVLVIGMIWPAPIPNTFTSRYAADTPATVILGISGVTGVNSASIRT